MDENTTFRADKIKSELNTKETCRVCMFKQLEMTYLFDESSDIIEKILYCTGLQVKKNDGLPSHICNSCIQDLAVAHKFKSSCLLAYKTYQNLLKSEIKTELIYDDSDGYVENNDFFKVKQEPIKLEVEQNDSNELPKKTGRFGPRGPYKKRPRVIPEPVPKPKKEEKVHKVWCKTCRISFVTKAEKEEHQKSTHPLEDETWICEHCGKMFKKRSSMYSHAYTHLPPKHSCDQCDYKATYKHDMAKHKLVHAGLKHIQCQICAARFRTTSNLSSHIHREHEKQPKKHQCELCDKSFYDRTRFNRHMDSHNNIKRYECELCHTAFSRRYHWKRHRLQKHNIVVPEQRRGRRKVNVVFGDTEEPAPAGP